MKKRLMIITLAALMVSLLAAPVIAKSANAHHGNPNIPVITGGHGGHPEGSNVPGMAKIPNGPAGKSNIGHLYLFEKDIVSWDIIEGGAWGKMKYNLSGPTFDFVFNGHGLLPGADYTLIYYPDPWPGTGLICLGEGTVNGGGDIHIAGSVDTGDLPIGNDDNASLDEKVEGYDHTGAKIWLVPSSDVDCEAGSMAAWNSAPYLFEYDLITFDDTDVDVP